MLSDAVSQVGMGIFTGGGLIAIISWIRYRKKDAAEVSQMEITRHADEVAILRSVITELEGHNEWLSKRLQKFVSDAEARERELRDRIRELSREHKELEATLRAEVARLRQENRDLKAELRNLRGEG